MSIFNFNNYRTFLLAHLKGLPRNGRGEVTRIAEHLKVHPTLISMVLSGQRDLSQEQGFDLCTYLQLSALESECFLLLLQVERAGNPRLRRYLGEKITTLKKEASRVENRVSHDHRLNENERLIFYSSWLFSAIRLYCSTSKKGQTLLEICERFQVSRPRALEVVNFLVPAGLLVLEKDRYLMGISRTLVEHGSPHLPRHHMNWRVKAMQKSDHVSADELMFTFPISVSRNDFAKIRSDLVELLSRVSTVVKDSEAEDVACLNIDFFWVEK